MEKIRLRISGEQTDEAGNVDRNETAVEGILFREGNRFRVEYTERPSEGTDTVRSRLLLSEGGMEMVREGALRSHMTFQPGHSCRTEYGTPFGSMFMEIETEFYRLLERKKHPCQSPLQAPHGCRIFDFLRCDCQDRSYLTDLAPAFSCRRSMVRPHQPFFFGGSVETSLLPFMVLAPTI